MYSLIKKISCSYFKNLHVWIKPSKSFDPKCWEILLLFKFEIKLLNCRNISNFQNILIFQ